MVEQRTEKLIRSSALLVLQAVGATVVTLVLMRAVVTLGHRIPQPDLSADYLFALIWALVLGIAIGVAPLDDQDRACLLLLWLARVFVNLVVMLFYENHYPLDSYSYFHFATGSGRFDFLTNHSAYGTAFMYRLVRLHETLLPASFHATKLSFAMAGLAGVYIFYRAAVIFLGHDDRRILLFLGFTPSLLFWGSILGKDPLAMLGVAIYTYGVVGILNRRRAICAIWIVAGITLATAIRAWMAPIMALPLVVVVWQMMPSRSITVLFSLGCVLVGLAELKTILHMMNLFQAATAKELIEQLSSRGQGFEGGGSAAGASLLVTSWGDFLRVAPYGIFSALFRPLPGEVFNPFGLMAGLEDVAVL